MSVRLRGLMAAVVAAIIVIGLFGGAPRRVVAAPSSADDCPDILFLGARGSGEPPQPPDSVDNDPTGQLGLGTTLWNSFKALRLAVPGLRVEAEGVNYNAAPVFPNGDVPTNLVDHPGYYVEGVSLGGTEFVRVLREHIAECGDMTEYVLAGYSQGAWALHRALAVLNANERERVAAVLMFGDPLLNPGSPAVRMAKRHGGRGAAFAFSPRSTRRTYVPADLIRRTASYCLPGDPVCQPAWAVADNPLVVVNCAQGACAHLDYVPEGVDERAARFAARLVRPLSRQVAVTTTGLADAQVGMPYTATLTARRGRPPYRWRILSGRPAWLTLDSATGVLSGTPRRGQTVRLRIQVRDARGTVGQALLRLVVRRPLGSALAWTAKEAGSEVAVGPDHTVAAWGRTNNVPGYHTTIYKSDGTALWSFPPPPQPDCGPWTGFAADGTFVRPCWNPVLNSRILHGWRSGQLVWSTDLPRIFVDNFNTPVGPDGALKGIQEWQDTQGNWHLRVARIAASDGHLTFSPEVVGAVEPPTEVVSFQGGIALLVPDREPPSDPRPWTVQYVSDGGVLQATVELGQLNSVRITAATADGAILLEEGRDVPYQDARLISVTPAGVRWSESKRRTEIGSVVWGSDGSVGFTWVEENHPTTPATRATGVTVLEPSGEVRWDRPANEIFPNAIAPVVAGCPEPPLVADTAGHLVVSTICSGAPDPSNGQMGQEVAVMSLATGQTLLELPLGAVVPFSTAVDTGRLYVGAGPSTDDSRGDLHVFDVPILGTQLQLPGRR
jgi:hypothetical protein